MSHTFYDSPEDAPHPHVSVDVTHDFVWVFQHTDRDGNELETPSDSHFRKEELPAIYKAIGEYLALEADVGA